VDTGWIEASPFTGFCATLKETTVIVKIFDDLMDALGTVVIIIVVFVINVASRRSASSLIEPMIRGINCKE